MRIYLVGGAVRDYVLGLDNVKDRDWVVVGATPEEMLAKGYQQVGKDFPVFLHPQTNEEYALARIERKVAPGHQGFVCYSEPNVTLEQDLLRRDLTINAMAMDARQDIIDPYNGMADCKAKILRHVSEAFMEDPLRCLRLARFAAQLPGFKVAHETFTMCQKMVTNGELKSLSKPRIWQEWSKALICPDPNRFFDELYKMGAINEPATSQDLNKAPLKSSIRFALFAAAISDIDIIIKQIDPPKYHVELAKIICKHKNIMPANDGNDWLKILKDLDAFRRPERLDDWLAVTNHSNAFKTWLHEPKIIKTIFHSLQAINIQTIVAEGYKGKQISERLDQIRIKMIDKLIK